MSKIVVQIKGLYCEWDTDLKKPISRLMPKEEFRIVYETNNKSQDPLELVKRIKRAEEKGTSLIGSSKPFEEFLKHNKAGDNSESLTPEEIVLKYGGRNERILSFTPKLEGEIEKDIQIPTEEEKPLKKDENEESLDTFLERLQKLEQRANEIDGTLEIYLQEMAKSLEIIDEIDRKELEEELRQIGEEYMGTPTEVSSDLLEKPNDGV